MAGAGLGRGVALIGRREHRALLQPGKTAGEARAILREQIGAELVNRKRNDQTGRRGESC